MYFNDFIFSRLKVLLPNPLVPKTTLPERFLTKSDTNRLLRLEISGDCTIYIVKAKALIICTVTA